MRTNMKIKKEQQGLFYPVSNDDIYQRETTEMAE